MKFFTPIIGLALAGSLYLSACQKDVPSSASHPEISFNQEVMPIIASNCTASGCHGLEKTEEFTLLSYDDVFNNGEINAGDPRGSKLYQLVTSPTSNVMPPSPNHPLTEEQTARVYLWILQGAKNN